MRHRIPHVFLLFVIASLVLVVGGCKKPPPEVTPAPPPQEDTAPPPPPPPDTEVRDDFVGEPIEEPAPPEPSIDVLNDQGVLKIVHFGFDRYDLDEEARTVLQGNARWLMDNPRYMIRIEGHCDERGTIEYNIALGQRRADAVRDYLVDLGVDGSRLRTISFGEERPANPGHNDTAWAENRRAASIIES